MFNVCSSIMIQGVVDGRSAVICNWLVVDDVKSLILGAIFMLSTLPTCLHRHGKALFPIDRIVALKSNMIWRVRVIVYTLNPRSCKVRLCPSPQI